jgi:hypothetical protein
LLNIRGREAADSSYSAKRLEETKKDLNSISNKPGFLLETPILTFNALFKKTI